MSRADNSKLTIDCMEAFTAAVLRIKSKTFDKEFNNDGKLDEALKLYDTAIAESVANDAEATLIKHLR